MDNILITFPRQTVAESYEAAKKFVESINLDVNDLHINEETWGIVVPSDTQAEFLEHAGNLGGKVFLLEEEQQPQVEEKTWIEVHEAVVGARFEMNGSQPVGKQEGRVLPGRYYVMGMQESDGSTFVTLARVDNVAELGKRNGPGRYVYAVDADTLGEAVNRQQRRAAVRSGRREQMRDVDAAHDAGDISIDDHSVTSAKVWRSGARQDRDKYGDPDGALKSHTNFLARDLAKSRAAGGRTHKEISPHAHMDGSQGHQRVESRQTRSDAILDMLLENDPGILAEKAKEEKAEQQRIALEEAAKAKEVVNENVEPSLEDLLQVAFNESARSEMARKAEKAGEEVAPAPVVEPQPEPEVAVEEPVEEPNRGLLGKLFGTNESVGSSVVEESFSGADVLSGLLESVGETEGQHADETNPDNWMVDEFTSGEAAEDLQEGEMPSKDHVMKMCRKGMSMEDMLKMHKDADQDKLKAMIKSCMEEMKESEEAIEEGIDPAEFGAVRDVMAQLIEEGVDLENLSDEELVEAVDNKCGEILAEEEQPSEEPVLAEGEGFEDEGFEVVAEADLSTEAEEVVEEAMHEEEGEEDGEEEGTSTLKDVLKKKAAEMAAEGDDEEEGEEEESEEVAEAATNRGQQKKVLSAARAKLADLARQASAAADAAPEGKIDASHPIMKKHAAAAAEVEAAEEMLKELPPSINRADDKKEESFDGVDHNKRIERTTAAADGRRQQRNAGGGAEARKAYNAARRRRGEAYADARDAGVYPEDQDAPPLPSQKVESDGRRIQGLVDPDLEAAARLHGQQDPRNKKTPAPAPNNVKRAGVVGQRPTTRLKSDGEAEAEADYRAQR